MDFPDDDDFKMSEEQLRELFRTSLAQHERGSPARIKEVVERIKVAATIASFGNLVVKGAVETVNELLRGVVGALPAENTEQEDEFDDD